MIRTFTIIFFLLVMGCQRESPVDVSGSANAVNDEKYQSVFASLKAPWATRAHQCFPMSTLISQWGKPESDSGFSKGYAGMMLTPLVAFSNPWVIFSSMVAVAPIAPRQSIWSTEDLIIKVDHSRTLFCAYKDHVLRIVVTDKDDFEIEDVNDSLSISFAFNFNQEDNAQQVKTFSRSGELAIFHEAEQWSGEHEFSIDYASIDDIAIEENYELSSELSYELSARHFWVGELAWEKHRFDDIVSAMTSTVSYRYTPKMTHDLTVYLEPGIAYQRSELVDSSIEFDTKWRWKSGLEWELSPYSTLEFFVERSQSVNSDLESKSLVTALKFDLSENLDASFEYENSREQSDDNDVDDRKSEFRIQIGYEFEVY